MTSYSNSEKLFRIAVGPGTEDYNWTEVLMRNIPAKLMDGISIHHYSVINWQNKGSATQFTEQEYYTTVKEAMRLNTIIAGHKKVMDKYDPQKKVALIVDEWGTWYNVEPGTHGAFLYQQNTMRDAIVAGLSLNIMNNHCDRVKMANLAQMVNVLQAVILTDKEKIILTPTYHVMEMYTVHHDALLLPVLKIEAKNTLEKNSTDLISISASRKNNSIHISLVNIDARQTHRLSILLEETNIKNVTGRILSSSRIQDHNTFSNPELVHPKPFSEFQLSGNKLEISLPPFSIVVLQLND